MFFLIGAIILFLGCIPLILTIKNSNKYIREKFHKKLRNSLIVIALDVIFLVLANIFFDIFTEYLWFENLTYESRYWTVITAKILLFCSGMLVSFVFLYINMRIALKKYEKYLGGFIGISISFILAIIFGSAITGLWEETLIFFNQASSDVKDPIFNQSVGFYMFSLPFLRGSMEWLLSLIALNLILIGIGALFPYKLFFGNEDENDNNELNDEPEHSQINRKEIFFQGIKNSLTQIFFLLGIIFILLAISTFFGMFNLMYSTDGAVIGVGYLEKNFKTLGYIVSIIVYAALGILLILGMFVDKIKSKLSGISYDRDYNKIYIGKTPLIIAVSAVVLIFVFNAIVPGIAKELVLKPNEISLEKKYIPYNIEFTQKAYGISEETIQMRDFEIGGKITQEVIQKNRETLDNVRLWDWRALIDNLKQQQEIRLYYEFNDVDIDRYNLKNRYRQVMLAVRELEKGKLAEKSKTWVSSRFKYTHGYGLVLTPVHEFLSQGKPNLLIKNIPPEEEIKELDINRPEIYYGERTKDHVYVNTKEKEFDYPMGEQNVYTFYEGKGGVRIDDIFKRFAYAWKFDGYKLIFSSYFTNESRVMFDRHIIKRARKLAPFLTYDADPYAIITDDGRIKYIIDAYTISNRYPYSQIYTGNIQEWKGINYIRNSVKVVVDAYDGTVEFYIADKDDIIIQTYDKIFPDMFQKFEEMPDYLKKHIRYPTPYLTVQAEMYSTYHMEDVEVFYQREDVWQFATERYRENFQNVMPYYVMIRFPGNKEVEFVNMLPFTPKNKNVINAWMAGRCDFPNYGKLAVFKFPKGVEMLGPRQIEARIDQDAEMSKSMTLWGQKGSAVIRGNLLAIPLFSENKFNLLYVEPVFLQAEDAQLPEIKKIVIADQDTIVWDDDFEMALSKIIGEKVKEYETETEKETRTEAEPEREPDRSETLPEIDETVKELVNRLTNKLAEYENQREKEQEKYDELKSEVERLKQMLETGIEADSETDVETE